MVQDEADEAILNGIVSRQPGRSSRQASQPASQQTSVKLLTRPVSSGKDPTAGFSFTKAQPMQQLDFRRPKQGPVVSQAQDLSRSSEGVPTELHSHQPPPLPNINHAVHSVNKVAAYQSPSSKHHDDMVLKDPLSTPFPTPLLAHSRAFNDPTPTTISCPITLNLPSTRAQPNNVSTATDDSMSNSNLNGTNEPRLLNIIIPNHSKHTTTAPVSIQNPAGVVKVADQPEVYIQNPICTTPKDPLTSVAGASKVTKSRRKDLKATPARDGPPTPSNPKIAYTEDDLLRLLMYRRRQGQQELEYFRASQHQKEAEVQKLREMSNSLSEQLQEVVQRETQKTAELSKFRANKPIWERKIKRLSDYVQGLGNDHKRLREDADDLQKQHADVLVAGKEIHNTLEDAQKSVEKERMRSQKHGDDARRRIETLTQTIQNQSAQLRSDETLLIAEKDRNDRLEDQTSRITTSQGQLLELFTDHRDAITGRVDNLLHEAKSIVVPSKTPELQSDNSIKPMLEQCVGMLGKLHEADVVKPEDLRKLNDTMDSFVRGITLSVEACEESSTSIEAGQKQIALAMQDQLRALSGNILSEHALSEQISDLREVRATVRERLLATESSLADARREVIALRLRDQEHSRRIMTLETDVAKAQSQSAETPQALLRIQELDSRNKDLQCEIVTLRKEAVDLSNQLKQSSTEARQLTERLTTTQERLEAANKDTASLREEKSTSERKAALEQEELRKALSKAANMQVASIQNEHMNAIQQMKLENSSAEEKLKNVTKQVNISKAEKEKSQKEISHLQKSLKEAQSDTDAVTGTRKALQLHLKEMEVRMQEKNIEHQDMQAMLNKAHDQVQAKDLAIVALQASQATRTGPSKVIEQGSPIRKAEATRNGHALLRDSHRSSLDQSPSSRPVESESSRHFTNRPQVVEDSQPTGKPSFVSLDDLILEDPFAGYAQEGPQTIAGEDISHLFPSTPGAGSHAKNLDYSRRSVVHTTVVSETQRRQNQSFREATPHTSTHTTNKPQSQSQARTPSRSKQVNARPRSSMARSPAKVNTSHQETNALSSQREASITRESTQPQGSVKDPRQVKRNTVAAGFHDTTLQARPSKVQKPEPAKRTKALGPVIEESQSPLLNGRNRKMTRRKSSAPRVDKFTRRFNQVYDGDQ